MTESEADALPRCERCGNRITRPASRVLPGFDQLHWTCLDADERADVRTIERETAREADEYFAELARLGAAMVAADVRHINERVRLGTL